MSYVLHPVKPSPGRRVWRRLTNPEARLRATAAIALVALAAGAAMLLPAPNTAAELPGDEALGTLATHAVRAHREAFVADPEATEGLREAASRSVRSVYDLDVRVALDADRHIADAFDSARDAQSELVPMAGRKARAKVDVDVEREKTAAGLYPDFLRELQAVVDEAAFAQLARLGFPSEVEQAARVLARTTLAEELVEGRELLLAERASGITVRLVGGPTHASEHDLRQVELVPDMSALRADLMRLGQGLTEAPGSHSGVFRAGLGLSPTLSDDQRRLAAAIAAAVVRPNLAFNGLETQERRAAAREAVKPVLLHYTRGERVVSEGERIERRHLLVFHHLRNEARAIDELRVRLGAALFAILVVVSVFRLARQTLKGFRPTKRDLIFLAVVLLGHLALLRVTAAGLDFVRDRHALLRGELLPLLLPMAAGTMLVRMLRSGESSIVYTLVFVPLASWELGTGQMTGLGLITSLVAADRLGRRTGAAGMLLASLAASLAAATVVSAFALFGSRLSLAETPWQAGAAVVGAGVLSPLIALLAAPLAELFFGYASEGRIARLANLNHPVLKELIVRAPGTYHHSIIVGSLAEAAARRIGAHPLLARVGGLFHDIGKAQSPLSFSENQRHENRLEQMAPSDAAAILRKHVEDGERRARRARLPRVIQELIRQHHGTRDAGAFLQRARSEASETGEPMPDEALFHYDGPKPRSREAGIVMLADAVEAATVESAQLSGPALYEVVERVVEGIVHEGQLDACDLSLADVHAIIDAFVQTLGEVREMGRISALGGPTRPPPPRPGSGGPRGVERLPVA